MSIKKKKGFTLIELIAVLVILAILALIVTPLVMNIIRKARISADKRSIDAYGRSVELAIANYLLDNGDFPTEISQLTIEYSGDRVECTTTQLKSDSSIYLAGCTVGGRSVDGYTYGKEEAAPTPTYAAYEVGDEVTYNNVDYYVIKDSSASEETVTMLKAEPLSVEEVNQYGTGHINRYTSDLVGIVNNYGGMAYYSSETCGRVNNNYVETGCTTDYELSDIKYVVDGWAVAKVSSGLVGARLITYDELVDDLGCVDNNCANSSYSWVIAETGYWTMSSVNNSDSVVWIVSPNGSLKDFLHIASFNNDGQSVRPVITIKKSALN